MSKKFQQQKLFPSTLHSNKKKNKDKNTEGVDQMERLLRERNIDFVKEYKFSKSRNFRFDFAIPHWLVAIEYEGIFSQKSRHTSVTGFTRDCTKYNEAAKEGWTVLRYTMLNINSLSQDLEDILTWKKFGRK